MADVYSLYGVQVTRNFQNLEEILHGKWAKLVPQAYNKKIPITDREGLQAELISTIQQFLSQSSNPLEVFKKLKASDDPALFCGRAFRNGEPTYSCRDCAYDPTCVLCMECFEKSVHKHHKYRISTSGGGGYCDCGDKDAWKSSPACSEHDKAAMVSSQDPEVRLPAGMVERTEALFQCILRYCYNVLVAADHTALPPTLLVSPCPTKDIYYTMLLNDETHTYEQVITRLMKALDLTNKEAVDHATTVDREGRASVFGGPKHICEKIAVEIKKKFSSNDPKILEATVMHHSFVAHQDFAQALLKWLEETIEYSDALRKIFCRVAMRPESEPSGRSILENILLADTKFWKAVRLQFHQLFMSGVFKDVESKTQFAILLTKHYIDIYRDFVRDDHYRTVSATVVTVQVYTVTPIARILIEKHSLIEIILRTILIESEKWKNSKGILSFHNKSQGEDYIYFKRAQFVLHDLKYALGCTLVNLEWNSYLQASFLKGFTTFLELLAQIQGMDASKRYTTHHIEYEMEWETAFTMQLKLTDVITLFIHHCMTNPEVLVAAYASVLRCMPKLDSFSVDNVTIAGHTVACRRYDVGDPESRISIHLPLHRILAGLNNHLPDGVNFSSAQFAPMNCEMELFNLLEEPLRVQVMIAQVHAEMWKRNGYSIQSQVYYYQYVKCRPEMYDRDIQLMQSIAALMEPNSFLIRIIHKFNLTKVFQGDDYQSCSLSVRQMTELLHEMLQLLVVVLGERYVEGVGQVTHQQIVQREIIHLLSIGRSSHSDLDKHMPEDLNYETHLESNVREVAEFTRTSTGKGMYCLKDECRGLFNPCFYHYTKTDQSKAEDSQKMHRKNAGLDQALPVPMTPAWTTRFAGVSRLFTCDVMLHVVHTLLSNMVAKRSKMRSEAQMEKVLHLITMALHEDKLEFITGNKTLPFVTAARNYYGSTKHFSERLGSRELSILDLLGECQNSEHVVHQPLKDLLGHVLQYFSSVADIGGESSQSLSRVRSSDSLENSAQVALEKEKKKRAKKAAKSKSKMMERMMRLQRKFMDEVYEDCGNENEAGKGTGSAMEISDEVETEPVIPVALGPNKTAARSHLENYVCILCQDASTIDEDSTVIYSAFVRRSTVLSRNRSHLKSEKNLGFSSLFVPSELSEGVFTTSCGHPMHASCFKTYYDSSIARERRRAQRPLFHYANPAFDVEKGEFFCPLCESIANCVLPVLPSVSRHELNQSLPTRALSLSDWLTVLTQLANPDNALASLEDNCPIPDLAKAAADTVYTNFMELYDFLSSSNQTELSEEMATIVTKFLSTAYSVSKNKKTSNMEHLEDPDATPIIWNTAAYTIQVIEQLLRSDNKPLFGHLSQRQEKSISLLVRFLSVCHKVIQQSYVKGHCRLLLQGLLTPNQPIMRPSSPTAVMDIRTQRSNSLIDIDAFHYLVSMCFSMSSLFSSTIYTVPAGSMNEQYLLHLLLAVHMVQIMLGYSNEGTAPPATGIPTASADQPPVTHQPFANSTTTDINMDTGEDNFPTLVTVFNRLYSAINSTPQQSVTDESQLENHLITASLPFLRCAALLFSHLTDTPSPPALHTLCSPAEEFSVIANYLDIPSQPAALFTEEITTILINKCSNDKSIASQVSKRAKPLMSVKYPLVVNSLINLPHDYSELVNSASRFMCPNSMGSEESRTPTLCLVCGVMLCSQSYCCQVEQEGRSPQTRHKIVGAATAHTYVCGAGIGILLRVRQCQIVLLAGKGKGCFIPAPYVDDYGETDTSLRRGNPLRLCSMAYKDLHRLWLSHGVEERVARAVSSSSGQYIVDWRHL